MTGIIGDSVIDENEVILTFEKLYLLWSVLHRFVEHKFVTTFESYRIP